MMKYASTSFCARIEDENGEDILVTVDDDEEFEDVADYFDDMLSDEADYDINPAEEQSGKK